MRLTATALLALALVAATASHANAAPVNGLSASLSEGAASPADDAANPAANLNELPAGPAAHAAASPDAGPADDPNAHPANAHQQTIATYKEMCPMLDLLPEPLDDPPAGLEEYRGIELTNVAVGTKERDAFDDPVSYRLGIDRDAGKCMFVMIWDGEEPWQPQHVDIVQRLNAEESGPPAGILDAIALGDEALVGGMTGIGIVEPYETALEQYLHPHGQDPRPLSLEGAQRVATAAVLALKTAYERGLQLDAHLSHGLVLLRIPDDTGDFPFCAKLDVEFIKGVRPPHDAKSWTKTAKNVSQMVKDAHSQLSDVEKDQPEARELLALAEEIKRAGDEPERIDQLLEKEPVESRIRLYPELRRGPKSAADV